MVNKNLLNLLRKALRFYTGFALSVLLLQLSGLLIYFIKVWPGLQNTLSSGIILYVAIAVFLVLVRSCLWIWIYWTGAGVLSSFHQEGKSLNLAPADWKSGDNVWLVMALGDQKVTKALMQRMQETVLKGRQFKSLTINAKPKGKANGAKVS